MGEIGHRSNIGLTFLGAGGWLGARRPVARLWSTGFWSMCLRDIDDTTLVDLELLEESEVVDVRTGTRDRLCTLVEGGRWLGGNIG